MVFNDNGLHRFVRTIAGLATVVTGTCLCIVMPAVAEDPIPNPNFADFFGGATGVVTMNGSLAPVGSVVEARDPAGVLCGRGYLWSEGKYGFMPVYGDDERTPGVDEGPVASEALTFYLNGVLATITGPDNNIWPGPLSDPKEVNLTISGVVTGLELITAPGDVFAAPGDTVVFALTFKNTGSVTDFYTLTATSVRDWTTLTPATFYVGAGLGNQTVLFRVVVPWSATNETDHVLFALQSGLSPLSINGSVFIHVTPTDVDDDPNALPVDFSLGQNYPNPFNPSTTIPFTLGAKSDLVTIRVYNLLGREMDVITLEDLSSGPHAVTYDASRLASGVYFYKIHAGAYSATRVMALVK